MRSKIEDALINLGIDEQDVPKILESVPQKVRDFEHNYSIVDLKKMFETLVYVNIAQNIRDKGMWIKEKNCPNRDLFELMKNFNLIDHNQWQNRSVITTKDGEKLSKAIIEAKIKDSELKETFNTIPQIVISILQNIQTLPNIFPNNSYVESYDDFPQDFIISLPYYNETVYKMCLPLYVKAVKSGWSVSAHNYVATRGGEERGEYYVLSDEIMTAINDFTVVRIQKEFEQQINEIKDKLYALKFLFHYYPDSYSGLGRYSVVEGSIIEYLTGLKETINTSKDLFTSGFTGQMPFMIRDADAYKTRIRKSEKELNTQLTDLFTGLGTQTSKTTATKVEKITKTPSKPHIPEPPSQINGKAKSDDLKPILVGFECGTGNRIEISPAHLFISGVTQKAGKTTTLEALIHRSGFTALSFVTKPDEKCFENGHQHLPFFSENIEWKTLEGLFQSLLGGEKTTSLRARIIKLCKNEKTLSAVKNKIDEELKNEKVKHEDHFILIQAYIEDVFNQLQNVKYTSELKLNDGINIMDLQNVGKELQSYIINCVLKEILYKKKNTIVIIPEAWKFIPQSGGSACKKSIEELIRQGANNYNFLWFDSQDIANVDKKILKSVFLWILGLQTETNEAQHTIKQIPLNKKKRPTEDIIMTLDIGEFFVCEGTNVNKTYIMPKWMEESKAQEVAKNKSEFHK